MGQVFEAINQNTDRRVAIKTLHTEWTRQPVAVQRFLREARAATKIRHPNVVDVLDLDVDQATGAPYIVQEFLAGESLEAYVESRPEKRLAVDESLRILVPVMEALVAAHRLGIVHRDLKPANLFLALDRAGAPTPKVIDFGIAKLMETQSDNLRQTATGAHAATPPPVRVAATTPHPPPVHDTPAPPAASPAITSRWWFWTGLGAVVAGGTVLALGLTGTFDYTQAPVGGTAYDVSAIRW